MMRRTEAEIDQRLVATAAEYVEEEQAAAEEEAAEAAAAPDEVKISRGVWSRT